MTHTWLDSPEHLPQQSINERNVFQKELVPALVPEQNTITAIIDPLRQRDCGGYRDQSSQTCRVNTAELMISADVLSLKRYYIYDSYFFIRDVSDTSVGTDPQRGELMAHEAILSCAVFYDTD